MIHWDHILLLTGSCLLLFASDPQPRFLAILLVFAATLGISLREHDTVWAVLGIRNAGFITYITLNLIALALSPAQLLLLFFLEDGPKLKAGIVIFYPDSVSENNTPRIHVE
jgi:hypothetical protein